MYESILYPSAGISHNYESWLVLTDEGQTINGVLLGESADEVRIKDDKGIVHSITADSIEEKKKLELSLMPADLHELLTEQELVDLVSYLATLKKVAVP
jgi:putative heme-binding domain-containing protein